MIGGRASLVALHHARPRLAWSRLHGLRGMATSANERTLLQFVSLDRLAHQGHVHLQIADAATAPIRVVPTLQQSDFALRVFTPNTTETNTELVDVFDVVEEAEGKIVRLNKQSSSSSTAIEVELHVPHLVDLDINVVRGDVTISDKIEGNVRVTVSDGDVTVNKVRGEQIHLKTNRGRVHVAALVEGEQVKMAANAVTVKRLMSAATEIKIAKGEADSDLGAIYSSLCLVTSQSTGSLTVGNIHGFLRVNGDEMKAVHVHSVNGTLHIEDSGPSCTVDAHFDAWTPDAANKIFVGGTVRVSLDPSAPMDLELHGNTIATGACQFRDRELEQLDDDYAMFTGSLVAATTAPSHAGASGKVNLGNAKTSAMTTSFFAAEKDPSDHCSTSASSEVKKPVSHPRLVVHASHGSVSVEQLDWMGKIKRKHLKQ